MLTRLTAAALAACALIGQAHAASCPPAYAMPKLEVTGGGPCDPAHGCDVFAFQLWTLTEQCHRAANMCRHGNRQSCTARHWLAESLTNVAE
jgi:hypothetical protein